MRRVGKISDMSNCGIYRILHPSTLYSRLRPPCLLMGHFYSRVFDILTLTSRVSRRATTVWQEAGVHTSEVNDIQPSMYYSQNWWNPLHVLFFFLLFPPQPLQPWTDALNMRHHKPHDIGTLLPSNGECVSKHCIIYTSRQAATLACICRHVSGRPANLSVFYIHYIYITPAYLADSTILREEQHTKFGAARRTPE